MSEYPGPPGSDGEDWTVRDDEEYPLVGRKREIELHGETVTAEAKAGWLRDGEPTAVTVETADGWLHCIDRDTWRGAT